MLGCVRDRRWFEYGEAGFGGHLEWVGCSYGPLCQCKLPYYIFFQVAVIRTGKLSYSKCFSFLMIYQSNRDRCK